MINDSGVKSLFSLVLMAGGEGGWGGIVQMHPENYVIEAQEPDSDALHRISS